MKESLSKLLVPFYPVAGRLKKNEKDGRLEIDCNAKGVLYVDVEAQYSLGEFGDLKISTEFCELVMPALDYSGGLSSFPLLIVRVTRFKCGGVCMVLYENHQVADGIGFAYLINSWSRLARGLEIDAQPVHDRWLYLGPRHPPRTTFRHLEYEPPLPPLPPKLPQGTKATTRQCLFNLSRLQINALAASQEATSKLSTYEVLAGHIWRSACKARGLTGNQDVKLYMPTDGRTRFKDPVLPQGYFGNVIFFTACIAKASDITSKPLWYAASKVHEALQRMEDAEYLRSAIDHLESQPDLTPLIRGPHVITCANLLMNSWGRLPFYEANFGWGKPKYVGNGGITNEGQSVLTPNPERDGSFSLRITLFALHMTNFESYLYEFKSLSKL